MRQFVGVLPGFAEIPNLFVSFASLLQHVRSCPNININIEPAHDVLPAPSIKINC